MPPGPFQEEPQPAAAPAQEPAEPDRVGEFPDQLRIQLDGSAQGEFGFQGPAAFEQGDGQLIVGAPQDLAVLGHARVP